VTAVAAEIGDAYAGTVDAELVVGQAEPVVDHDTAITSNVQPLEAVIAQAPF
jgi:hypothetical protein